MNSIKLNSVSLYAILAYSTVTSTGPTIISGNVGVSPGTSITGESTITNGSIEAGNTNSAIALNDSTNAYLDGCKRIPTKLITGNLGGQKLYRGVYKSTDGLEISSGDLILDAQHDTTSVFIFQMETTFTMSAGRQIILTNGAKASNVFWIVGSSAVFETTVTTVGTIIAYASISLKTNAKVNGRVLALNGSVTMDSNTIVMPL